jgi:hypothetical protein
MSPSFTPIDLSMLRTCNISDRKSMVNTADFAKSWKKGAAFQDFLAGLPNILAGSHVREVVSSIADAAGNGRTVIMGMGAHVIKVGLSPVVIDLMERRVVTAVAMNGAGIIHDLEVAMAGMTSEDVAESLGDGSFGITRETGIFLNEAVKRAGRQSIGLGESVGLCIKEKKLPFAQNSILAAGARLGIPVTVHVAVGTDIVHIHPEFDPRDAGEATHRDFRIFASVIATLEKGVYLNVGSAVILPEVFLKSVTLVRNLGHRLQNFTTVNMDFIQHYRPTTNVVGRPTAQGGKGYSLIGHHELMLPLVAAGVIEAMG